MTPTDKTEIAALVERLRNDHAPYWDRQASCARGPETARGYYQRVDQSLRAAALVTALAEERERMREALAEIANAKPERVADGFVQGPAVLWAWAQRTARAALKGADHAQD